MNGRRSQRLAVRALQAVPAWTMAACSLYMDGPPSTDSGVDAAGDSGLADVAPGDADAGDAAPIDGGSPDAGDADADAPDSGVWDPTALGGSLVVWLDAARGVTQQNGAVSGWADQSGNGNHASQSTAMRQPHVIANQINGKPSVRFDGTHQQHVVIADAPSLEWGTGDFTVMEVAMWKNAPSSKDGGADNNTGYGALWMKIVPNFPWSGAALLANDPAKPSGAARAQVLPGTFVTSSSTGLNDGKFHRVGMRRGGATLEVRADGVQGGVANAPFDVTNNDDVFIGSRGGNGGDYKMMLDGDIAEVIAVKGSLSDPDLALLELYLKSKYKL